MVPSRQAPGKITKLYAVCYRSISRVFKVCVHFSMPAIPIDFQNGMNSGIIKQISPSALFNYPVAANEAAKFK